MTQEELKDKLEKHQIWLKQKWMGEDNRLNLEGANFEENDFKEVDFHRTKMSEANLKGMH